MYIRKTMVLSSLGDSAEKAVLNLESERDMLVGSVRLYNFENEPNGILSLGVLVDGKVYKAGLKQKSRGLYTFETETFSEITEKFSCAIVNIKNGKATPILLGATDGKKVGVSDIKLASSISLLDEENLTIEKTKNVLDNNNIDYSFEEKKLIEKEIDKQFKKINCNSNENVQNKEEFDDEEFEDEDFDEDDFDEDDFDEDDFDEDEFEEEEFDDDEFDDDELDDDEFDDDDEDQIENEIDDSFNNEKSNNFGANTFLRKSTYYNNRLKSKNRNPSNDEDCDSCNEKCNSCKYRDAFYKEGDEVVINSSEKIKFNERMVEPESVSSFYDEVSEQINMLFESYPEESFLVSIIPNSKWVKIDISETGEYYVVGLIYEDDEIRYICYGIPAMFSSLPPKELNGVCQWLPIDADKAEDFGYWITYQDAQTGENIEVDVV